MKTPGCSWEGERRSHRQLRNLFEPESRQGLPPFMVKVSDMQWQVAQVRQVDGGNQPWRRAAHIVSAHQSLHPPWPLCPPTCTISLPLSSTSSQTKCPIFRTKFLKHAVHPSLPPGCAFKNQRCELDGWDRHVGHIARHNALQLDSVTVSLFAF